MPIGYVEESQHLPIPLRPRPSDLEFPPPDCPHCDGTLEYDDGWDCHTCKISWPSNGMGGKYVDWDAREPDKALTACLSTIAPHDHERLEAKYEDIRHLREQCALPAGHDGDHQSDGYTSWKHDSPRIVHHSIEDAEYHGVNPDLTPLPEDGDDG